jgi:rubrerythrin
MKMDEQALPLKRCLDACQEIEEIASQIYHFNADLFADNDKISRLWRKTALEEENHALQVVLVKRIVKNIPGTHLDIFQSEATRNLIRALFEAIKRTHPPLEEAIRTAIVFEEMLARFHMDNACSFEEKEIAGLFKALMMHDREHIEDLESALKNYSLPEG